MSLWAKILSVFAGIGRKSVSISVPIKATGYTNDENENPDPVIEKEELKNVMLVDRKFFTDRSTISEWYDVDRVTRLCCTLEDTCRKNKIPGRTAIPSGRYQIKLAPYGPDKILHPCLLEVPFFTGIFVHAGNTDADTRGCLLTGMRYGIDVVYDSKKALFGHLLPRVTELLEKGDLFVEIVGGYSKDRWENPRA